MSRDNYQLIIVHYTVKPVYLASNICAVEVSGLWLSNIVARMDKFHFEHICTIVQYTALVIS